MAILRALSGFLKKDYDIYSGVSPLAPLSHVETVVLITRVNE